MDAAERRLARVAAHLVPSFPAPHATGPPLAPSPAAASSSSSSPAGDSYRRVHGDVPSEPPEWRTATDESGKEFVDIIYEKAVGEGIAKVRLLSSVDPREALDHSLFLAKAKGRWSRRPRGSKNIRTKLVCCLWITRSNALFLRLVFLSTRIAAADHH
jgi:hypothetical protein